MAHATPPIPKRKDLLDGGLVKELEDIRAAVESGEIRTGKASALEYRPAHKRLTANRNLDPLLALLFGAMDIHLYGDDQRSAPEGIDHEGSTHYGKTFDYPL
jgi:hypothetical protein